MEGPSLFLAAEQLSPFVGQLVKSATGNTKKISPEIFIGKKILSIFSFGKTLYFQFDSFALRVHFMLFGSFEATVKGKKVTGDYPKKVRVPRLAMEMKSGHIEMYSCSLMVIDSPHARELCDFSTDIMSQEWDEKKVVNKLKKNQKEEIADVLLDQTIFTGVGNIIKNEVLLRAKVLPTRKVEDIPLKQVKQIVQFTRQFVFQFYEWRKVFELRKHYTIYRQKFCKVCGTQVIKGKTGARNRMSFICSHCQK